jgi:excisionase family DNA binding protein
MMMMPLRNMADTLDPTQWITTSEATALTGYAAAYFRQLIAHGRLHAQKRGRDWFLRKSEVLEYADEMERLGTAKYDPWRSGGRQKRIAAS